MANPEHVEILKQGVESWNQWREDNPDIIPDFHEAKLNQMDLPRVNFQSAILMDAHLNDTNFSRANLVKTNFTRANLIRANLTQANCSGAILIGAQLIGALLADTNLNKADLDDADIRATSFLTANLSKTQLHGVKLYGIARDEWLIKGAKCSHIYDDQEGINRVPKNREFEEGEFESLYASLPSFEYIFENGMQPLDPVFMNQVAENIKAKNPEFDLKIDSMNARGIQPTIKFTVKHEHKESAELAVREDYEKTIVRLKGREEAFKEMLQSFMGSSPVQISGGNFPGANFGSNQGTQSWNLTQIDNSTNLDDETKGWLKSVASQLQDVNLDEADLTIAQAKLETFQLEIEKDQKEEGKIKKTWDMLVALAPDIQKLSSLPESINKIIGPLLGG